MAEGQPEAGAEDSQVQRTAAVEAGGARGRGGSRHRRGRLGGARRSAVPILQGPGAGPRVRALGYRVGGPGSRARVQGGVRVSTWHSRLAGSPLTVSARTSHV